MSVYRSADKKRLPFPSVSTPEKGYIFEQVQKLFLKAPVTSEHLEALLVEYLRFIHLKKSRPSNAYQPCEEVDAMWHAHIVCTKIYHDFCTRCNGGLYIHHTPDRNTNVQTYRNTLKAYSKEFGNDPNPVFWTGFMETAGSGAPVVTAITQATLEPSNFSSNALLADIGVGSSEEKPKSGVHVIKIPDFHLTLEDLDNAVEPTGAGCTMLEKVAMCQINAMQKLKVIFDISEIKYKDAENGLYSYIGEQATSSPGCASNAIFFCKRCHHVWEFGFCNRDSSCLKCRQQANPTAAAPATPVAGSGPATDKPSHPVGEDHSAVDYIVRCFGCG
jgi:hypothetical protein